MTRDGQLAGRGQHTEGDRRGGEGNERTPTARHRADERNERPERARSLGERQQSEGPLATQIEPGG